jgi:hypothetical protein
MSYLIFGTPVSNKRAINIEEYSMCVDADGNLRVRNLIWNADTLAWEAATGSLTGGQSVQPPTLTTRMDTVGDLTYVGKAVIGSADGSAVWQIQRIDETSGIVIKWADGNSNFDNIWSNHLALTYL